MDLSPQMTRQLAAESMIDPKTVRKAYRVPESCSEKTLLRLRKAADALKVPPPPSASTSEQAP